MKWEKWVGREELDLVPYSRCTSEKALAEQPSVKRRIQGGRRSYVWKSWHGWWEACEK